MTTDPTLQSSSLETLDNILLLIEKELNQSKQAIQTNLETEVPFLTEIIQYITSTGKTPLRSITLALSARLFSYSGSEVPHISSVLEYLNTAAALHQKVVLTEEFRRQQKEMLNIWGNEASILLGDYLLSISFKTMTRLGNFSLLEIIAETTQSIARGQVLSISPFSWDEAESHALEIIRHKKASLQMAAAKSGAVLGEAPPEIQEALSQYGLNLGIGVELKKEMACIQEPARLLSALNIGHTSFPLCHLMQQMQAQNQQTALQEILEQKDLSMDHVQEIQSYFDQYQTLDYTRSQIQYYLEQSQLALAPLADLNPILLRRLTQLSLEF